MAGFLLVFSLLFTNSKSISAGGEGEGERLAVVVLIVVLLSGSLVLGEIEGREAPLEHGSRRSNSWLRVLRGGMLSTVMLMVVCIWHQYGVGYI